MNAHWLNRCAVLTVLLLVSLVSSVGAHEVRPGYLELTERAPGDFDVLWKVPMFRGAPLFIRPTLPDSVEPIAPIATRRVGDVEVKEWVVAAPEGLRGKPIAIQGLESTLTDVLVRAQFLDGRTETLRLTPGAPSGTIPEVPSKLDVAKNYFALGVEHILLGIDHLLFVLALLLLVKSVRLLVETVTAFTIAHSITLALAALGYVHVPPAPVEAVIALSIVFVAGEIVHSQMGRPGLSERYPYVVAFGFGLLHGIGFAGALTQLGLPQHAIPEALLFFNVGVEAGQLLFVAGALGIIAVLRRLWTAWPAWSYRVTPYAIGTAAMYWCVSRVVALV